MVAILGSLIFAAGVVVQQVGLESADTDVEQLDNFHDHATQLIAGQVLQGLGFALFAVTICVLFRASSGRAERMRRSCSLLALIGPPLFLIGDDLGFVRRQGHRGPVRRGAAGDRAAGATGGGRRAGASGGHARRGRGTRSRIEPRTLARTRRVIRIGSGLRVTATLAIAFALIYTPLWAMRTGLLTRFWASLRMALGGRVAAPPGCSG